MGMDYSICFKMRNNEKDGFWKTVIEEQGLKRGQANECCLAFKEDEAIEEYLRKDYDLLDIKPHYTEDKRRVQNGGYTIISCSLGGAHMGVSTKGRRTITYKEQKYIWWVEPYEDDCDRFYLRILSEDKSVILRYRVSDGSFIVVSEGRQFQGQKQAGTAKLYRLPLKEPIDVVTPKIVAELIEWAVYGKDAVPVR